MARSNAAVFVAVALGLLGCTSDPIKYPCPTFGVLKDAGTMTAFAGTGQDITDVTYRVSLLDPSLKCDYDGNKRVNATLRANLHIERGPAFANTAVDVPYFVAVTRGKKFVLARQEFAQSFTLSGAQLNGETEVPVEIPLAQNLNGAAYEVIIGLALTPQQLAYNRAHRN